MCIIILNIKRLNACYLLNHLPYGVFKSYGKDVSPNLVGLSANSIGSTHYCHNFEY
jgi:hypothetical protein